MSACKRLQPYIGALCSFAAYLQGWNWVDEGRDGRHKYGYVTEEANHDIVFVVSRFGPACLYSAKKSVQFLQIFSQPRKHH